LARTIARWMDTASAKSLFRHPRWIALTPSLSITSTSPAPVCQADVRHLP